MNALDEVRNGKPVRGRFDERFRPVAEAFLENFESRGEAGGSLCFSLEGETVVDLYGGHRDTEETQPWAEDTISLVLACTKAATALCAHLLAERGKLDLHAPVTDYWPEFGQNGKEGATVRMLLNHSVGLPALRDRVKPGGFYDWEYMTERLAAEAPFWEPGTRNGYHMMTFGWTVGEIVRRVSGKSLGTFFREEIALPLGLDFFIGLPESERERVAPMIPSVPDPSEPPLPFATALLADRKSIPFLALVNNGGYEPDAPEAYAAEIGAGGGIANARALAGMFTPLANGGQSNGLRLLSAERIETMRTVSVATECDATLQMPTRYGQGFMRSMDNRARPSGALESAILGREAFGQSGSGGSLGFADPECHLAFGYSMTKMGAGVLLNERGQSLVDATYRCLGYRTDSPGCWIR